MRGPAPDISFTDPDGAGAVSSYGGRAVVKRINQSKCGTNWDRHRALEVRCLASPEAPRRQAGELPACWWPNRPSN